MISISVRREKIVIRIVFEIKNTAVKINAMMTTAPTLRTVFTVLNKLSAVAPP